MSKFDEQMKRWETILGDAAEGTQKDALNVFFRIEEVRPLLGNE